MSHDRIWLTRNAKFAGIAKESGAERSNSKTISAPWRQFPRRVAQARRSFVCDNRGSVKAVLAGDLSPNITTG